MTAAVEQKRLTEAQLQAFYHDEFVEDQVRDFSTLVPDVVHGRAIVDVGGGCGFFARRLGAALGHSCRVIDMDAQSVEACARLGVPAVRGDALDPAVIGDEDVVCFNLILHHLVGASEVETRALQVAALRAWRGRARVLLVNEYIYESFIGHLSGWLIYRITNSQILSAIGRFVARVIPAFRANTFGVGVRFRSSAEWRKLFEDAGYRVRGVASGRPETVALPLRGLLIKAIRRDSFRLEDARRA